MDHSQNSGAPGAREFDPSECCFSPKLALATQRSLEDEESLVACNTDSSDLETRLVWACDEFYQNELDRPLDKAECDAIRKMVWSLGVAYSRLVSVVAGRAVYVFYDGKPLWAEFDLARRIVPIIEKLRGGL